LGKEEGLSVNEQGGGGKVFFVRRKRKGDWRGVGFCGGRSFDSIYSCNGDKLFNVYCLIVKMPGFFI
jgi:hypothetical protein